MKTIILLLALLVSTLSFAAAERSIELKQEVGPQIENGFFETALRDVTTGEPIYARPVLIKQDETGDVVEVTAATDDEIKKGASNSIEPIMISLGVQYTTNIKDISLTLGAVFAKDTGVFDRADNGVLIELEPGSRGGSVAVGYEISGWPNMNPMRAPNILEVSSVDVKAVVFRTWTAGGGLEVGDVLAGGQVDLKVFLVKLSLGVLQKINGSQGKSASVNFGFGLGI
jgi:hypothetical protein